MNPPSCLCRHQFCLYRWYIVNFVLLKSLQYIHFFLSCLKMRSLALLFVVLVLSCSISFAEEENGAKGDADPTMSSPDEKNDTNETTTPLPITASNASDATTISNASDATTISNASDATTISNASDATTLAPTTTQAPTPKPAGNPDVLNVSVTDPDGKVCIRAKMAVQFEIIYVTNDSKNATTHVNIPSDATSNGECGNDTQTLTLRFYNSTDKLSFEFYVVDGKVVIKELRVMIATNKDFFPDIKDGIDQINASAINVTDLEVSPDHSYLCKKGNDIQLSNGVLMKLSEVQLQAFADNDGTFLNAEECKSDAEDDASDIVPIAVGCALAGLVIIVLIAYLIGRRRSRQKGYQSV